MIKIFSLARSKRIKINKTKASVLTPRGFNIFKTGRHSLIPWH